jgi:hypothetical protein
VHAPFDSLKQYQLIIHNCLSHYQHCSDLWPLKVKRDRILSNYAMSEQRYNFGPVYILIRCNILVPIIINNCCVECLYFRDCIFKFVSFNFIMVYKNFRFLARLWANNNNKLAIPNGNTILKRQRTYVLNKSIKNSKDTQQLLISHYICNWVIDVTWLQTKWNISRIKHGNKNLQTSYYTVLRAC